METTIRPSSISMFTECGAKYYFAIIERIPVPKALPLAFGSAVHSAIETNFVQKVESKTDISEEAVVDAFSDSFEKETETVESTEFQEESKGAVKDGGIKLIKKYHNEAAPKIQPKLVEQRINAKFKGYDFTLSGAIDLIDANDILIDHKTTAKTPSAIADGYILQQSAYKLLAESSGIPIQSQRIDYLVRTQTPKIVHLEVKADTQYFLNVLQIMVDAIGKGVFIPNRSSFLCSRKWCKFWSECEKKYGGTVKC